MNFNHNLVVDSLVINNINKGLLVVDNNGNISSSNINKGLLVVDDNGNITSSNQIMTTSTVPNCSDLIIQGGSGNNGRIYGKDYLWKILVSSNSKPITYITPMNTLNSPIEPDSNSPPSILSADVSNYNIEMNLFFNREKTIDYYPYLIFSLYVISGIPSYLYFKIPMVENGRYINESSFDVSFIIPSENTIILHIDNIQFIALSKETLIPPNFSDVLLKSQGIGDIGYVFINFLSIKAIVHPIGAFFISTSPLFRYFNPLILFDSMNPLKTGCLYFPSLIQTQIDFDRVIICNNNYTGVGNDVLPYITCEPSMFKSSINQTNIYGNLINDTAIMGNNILLQGAITSKIINFNTATMFSDKRIKKDIVLVSTKDELNKVLSMKVNRYSHINTDTRLPRGNIGFIAQDLKDIDDDLVNTNTHHSIPDIMEIVDNIRIRQKLIIGNSRKIYDDIFENIETKNNKEYELQVINKEDDDTICSFTAYIQLLEDGDFIIKDSYNVLTPSGMDGHQYISNIQAGVYYLKLIGIYVDDFHTINYSRFNGYLVASIQELNKKLMICYEKLSIPLLLPDGTAEEVLEQVPLHISSRRQKTKLKL